MKIPFKEYIADSFFFSEEEIKLRDYFDAWLPRQIIDCHCHANLEEHVGFLDERLVSRPLSTFPVFSIEDSEKMASLFHPTKEIFHVRFPQPYKGMDLKGANNYLLNRSSEQDRIAVCGVPDDIDYTINILHHPRASALKMYYLYFLPPAMLIYQHFPKEVLEVAQELGKPIILHTPKPVPEYGEQLLLLREDFPNLKVIIAHLGMYSEPVERFAKGYEILAGDPNMYADVSMCPSSRLLEIVLDALGENNVMYGSDQPISLIRASQYEHPTHGNRMISKFKYHWIDMEDWIKYCHLAEGVVHAHWQTLTAVRTIIDRREKDAAFLKNKLFYENAQKLFGFK